MTESPSPFSAHNPKLQIAWDATSLSTLMKCARMYQYTILDGWRGSGNDIEFGAFYASAVETYKKGILSGLSNLEATVAAVEYVLRATWPANAEPWGGHFEPQWRCTGTEPYTNGRGNRAKCPWSHSGNWYPTPAPSTCGECGSPTHEERRWVSEDHAKNRRTLVRLVAWYCAEQDEQRSLAPVAFGNGQPAVELSFALPLPWETAYGERFILAGHMDSLASFGLEHFVTDNKTTKKPLTDSYFSQYDPNVQVATYNLAASIMWPELEISGVLIEAAQTQVNGAAFGMKIIYQTEIQRQEFFEELEWWMKQAERYATEGYWPMNRSACFLCHFKGVCSAAPARRQALLEQNFKKRHWNPLEIR